MNLSWITIVWSAAAAACVTIALVHLAIWVKQPGRPVHLVFAILAAAVAANAACELLLMHAQTTQQFGVILRWRHVPLCILVISLVVYIRLYLRAGSLWLAGAVCTILADHKNGVLHGGADTRRPAYVLGW